MNHIMVAREMRRALSPNPGVHGPWQWGTVTAVGSGTVDVQLDNNTGASVTIGHLASYQPTVGDAVLIARQQGASRTARTVLGVLGVSASGGFGDTYLGTTSLGASSEVAVGGTTYAKAVTPGQNMILSAIAVGIEDTVGSQYASWSVVLYDDSSGNPGKFIAAGAGDTNQTYGFAPAPGSGSAGVARFVDIPISAKLTSGTQYWISAYCRNVSGQLIHYDTSGSDVSMAVAAPFIADWTYGPTTGTSKNYSIRALAIY